MASSSKTDDDRSSILPHLLSQAYPANKVKTLIPDLYHRPLLLQPTSNNSNSNPNPSSTNNPLDACQIRARLRASKSHLRHHRNKRSHKPSPLNARQKRALCIYDVPVSQRKWEIFEPLHQLWLGYIRSIINVSSWAQSRLMDPKTVGATMTKADFHGAMLQVVRSRCVGRVGICGIVCKETKGTFEVVTRKNQLKVLPKEFSTFRLEIPLEESDDNDNDDDVDDGDDDVESDSSQSRRNNKLILEIIGDQFIARPAERSTRKFKLKIPKDI